LWLCALDIPTEFFYIATPLLWLPIPGRYLAAPSSLHAVEAARLSELSRLTTPDVGIILEMDSDDAIIRRERQGRRERESAGKGESETKESEEG
jgi:hypothetical protein